MDELVSVMNLMGWRWTDGCFRRYRRDGITTKFYDGQCHEFV